MIQEARAAIKAMIDKRLAQNMPGEHEIQSLVKELAENSKQCVKNLGKDIRYKYLIQVIVGHNRG